MVRAAFIRVSKGWNVVTKIKVANPTKKLRFITVDEPVLLKPHISWHL